LGRIISPSREKNCALPKKIFLQGKTFVQEYLNQNLNEKNISIDGSRIDGMRRVVGKKRFTKSQIDIKRQYKNRGFPEI
jgi:hypothetical protein